MLGLVPLQLAVALIGILARVAGVDVEGGLAVWLIDALLIVSAAGALAFLRTTSWS